MAFNDGYEKGLEEGLATVQDKKVVMHVPVESPDSVATVWALRTVVNRASKILEDVDDSLLVS